MARVLYSELEAWMGRHDKRAADAARDFDVSSQTFNGWRKRGQVSADVSDKVAGIMAEADATLTGKPSSQNPVRVLQFDANGDMGDGAQNDDFPDIVRAMDFDEPYIRALIGFVPAPGRLCLITGRGPSMIPVINPGDVVIVDTGITCFDGDGIYLINTGSGQQIKSLQERHGTIYVISANSQGFPEYALKHGCVIGGKVYLRNRIDRLS